MTRFARPLLVAILVLLFAVTPLSALIAPRDFEFRFWPSGQPNHGFVVRLADRTGLAKGLSVAPRYRAAPEAVANYGVDSRMLIVRLEGSSCDYAADLTFERANNGFLLRETTEGVDCFMGTGMSHTLAIHLWAPVEASTVTFVSKYDE